MIKAAFFDIDGTLVSFNTHQIPQSTVDAITELQQKGIVTCIATGRHPLAITNIGDLKFDVCVALNGGYCLVNNEIIYKQSIPREDILSLIQYQKNNLEFPVMVLAQDQMYISHINQDVQHLFDYIHLPTLPQKSLTEVTDMEILQLVSFFSEEQAIEIMSHMPHCEATRWYPTFADIVPAGSNKSIGIERVLNQYGFLPDEIIAFGDGGNDIEMLQYAGIGVAMGNANEEVKLVADYITDTVDGDGIRNALVHFGII